MKNFNNKKLKKSLSLGLSSLLLISSFGPVMAMNDHAVSFNSTPVLSEFVINRGVFTLFNLVFRSKLYTDGNTIYYVSSKHKKAIAFCEPNSTEFPDMDYLCSCNLPSKVIVDGETYSVIRSSLPQQ